MSQRELFNDRPTLPFKNPLAAGLVAHCQKCDCLEHVDVRIKHPPHSGRSVRRDCARCRWTLGFPEWYDQSEVAK